MSIFSKVKLDKFRRFASYVGLGEIGVLLFVIYILDERGVVLLFFNCRLFSFVNSYHHMLFLRIFIIFF